MQTGWVTIETEEWGLAARGPMDPVQAFRVMRIDHNVIVDLGGLALDESKPGMARLGVLPDWAAAIIPKQFFWINDSPKSLHQSQVGLYGGVVLYWYAQLREGLMSVARPPSLHGGIEFTTDAPFPTHLIKET